MPWEEIPPVGELYAVFINLKKKKKKTHMDPSCNVSCRFNCTLHLPTVLDTAYICLFQTPVDTLIVMWLSIPPVIGNAQ